MILTSRISVATFRAALLALPLSRRARCRTHIDVSVKLRSLICPSKVESHISGSRSLPFGALRLSFPTASIVPSSFFILLVYLLRDSITLTLFNALGFRLRARSYFFSAGKTPHLSLVSETTLCSFHTIVTSLRIGALLFPVVLALYVL